MAHLALYREWRPKTFDEVVEQKHAVYALKQSVASGQIAHAYLFSGTRGTGKTTMAKIFARAINCLQPADGNPCNQCAICKAALDGSLMDIIEMDAASNNSVDNIRRICDEIVFMPSQARYKVYIIDEVHMLSAGAFNALLKTLEEPPAHAVFILATTEAHRIPATILSRCQRYEFRRIPVDSMVARLQQIANDEAINIQPEALRTIASLADGALRDAISILDQARSAFPPPVTHDQVLSLVGVVRDQFLQTFASALLFHQVDTLLQLIDQLIMDGRDLSRFVTDLAQHLRNLLVCQVTRDDTLLVRVNSAALAEMRQLAAQIERTRLLALIRGLSALLSDLRWAADGRTALEIGLIRLTGLDQAADQPSAVRDGNTGTARTPVKLPQPADRQLPTAQDHTDQSIEKSEKTGQSSVSEQAVAAPATVPAATKSVSAALKATEADIPLPEPPPEEPAWIDDSVAEQVTVKRTQPSAGQRSLEGIRAQPQQNGQDAEQASKEPAAEPVINPEEKPVSSQNLAKEAADTTAIWQQVLDKLQAAGHMALYLFSRPAKISLCQGVCQIVFNEADTVHYQEVSQPASLKIIRDVIHEITGAAWQIQTLQQKKHEQADGPEHTESSWVDRVKKTAGQLGIPIELEE